MMPTLTEYTFLADSLAWRLLAQEEAAPAGGDAGFGGGTGRLLLLIGMITVLYIFLMVLPQRREQKRTKELMDNLKKNDRVLFSGGILGTIANVHQDGYVTIRIDDATNAKMRVLRQSISRVLTDEDSEEDQKATESSKS